MRIAPIVCASLVMGLVAMPLAASAQDTPQALRQDINQLRKDFDALKQDYAARLAALEAKLAAVEGTPPPGAQPTTAPPAQTAQVPPGAEGAGGPAGALPVYGAAIAASKVFNPDIAVIGDFLGAAGTNPVQPDPFAPGSHPNALQLHESEAAFQAVVHPSARADS